MSKNLKQHIGNTIKMYSNLAGLSQVQLAEKINKTRGLVSIIEKQGKVNHYTLIDIANALNTTVEELLKNSLNSTLVNEKQEPKDNTNFYNNELALKKEIELLKQLIEQQKKIIALLEKDK